LKAVCSDEKSGKCSRLTLLRRFYFGTRQRSAAATFSKYPDRAAAECHDNDYLIVNMQHAYPNRPPRLRAIYPGYKPVYFVTFNTYKRIPVLSHPEILEDFIAFCREAETRAVRVGYYVIMPTHIHLFVWCDPICVALQTWVKAIKCCLSKRLLTLTVAKPHWQEGFFDHLLRHAESYREKSAYVLMNPVRAGLCAQKEDWPYSGKMADLEM